MNLHVSAGVRPECGVKPADSAQKLTISPVFAVSYYYILGTLLLCDQMVKSALGAERFVPTRHFETTQAAINALRSELGPTWKLVGLETTSRSVSYTCATYHYHDDNNHDHPGGGTVLVLGNEVTGVDQSVLEVLDEVVEVPMFGFKNSLNVAAAAPIVMYEVLRQRGLTNRSRRQEQQCN